VGESNDLALRVGVDGRILGRQHQGPVRPHAIQSHREELLDLTSVVFVRNSSHRLVRLVVAEHVEIAPHRGSERGVDKNVPEVAKRVIGQLVVEVREGECVVDQPLSGNDMDFAQRKGDPLTELIVAGDGVSPPGIEGQRIGERSALGVCKLRAQHFGQLRCRCFGKLVVDPCFVTRHGLEHRNVADIRPESRLM
jgi:hypothetical protein